MSTECTVPTEKSAQASQPSPPKIPKSSPATPSIVEVDISELFGDDAAAAPSFSSLDSFSTTPGSIISAALKKDNWWPSLVLDPLWCRINPPKSGHIWIMWYGTNSVSQISTKNKIGSLFSFFNSKNFKKKPRSIQKALVEAVRDLQYR